MQYYVQFILPKKKLRNKINYILLYFIYLLQLYYLYSRSKKIHPFQI